MFMWIGEVLRIEQIINPFPVTSMQIKVINNTNGSFSSTNNPESKMSVTPSRFLL